MSFPAMIFAAGFGTRMRPITHDTPKPLVKVAGKPLIDYGLDRLAEAGISHIVANAHHLSDQIKNHLVPKGITINLEHPKILETGGGLKAALPKLGATTVLTLNSDVIWIGPNPIALLIDDWRPSKMDALLMCIPFVQARGHTGRGDFSINPDGSALRNGTHIYTGVQIIKTQEVSKNPLEIFSINQTWDAIAKSGSLFARDYPGIWCDVGHPEGIEIAEQILALQ
ncbi:MAG: nucleotidyltransferase family protein [Aestuariivita sp.]|nr:nucleotidyltransferase family protein [Aestuariivita sp.]